MNRPDKSHGLFIIRVKGGWVNGNITGVVRVPLEFLRTIIRGVVVCLLILAVYLTVTDNQLLGILGK
jgi:hypothetical protein